MDDSTSGAAAPAGKESRARLCQYVRSPRLNVPNMSYPEPATKALALAGTCSRANASAYGCGFGFVFLAVRDHVAAMYGRFSGRQLSDQRGLPRHQVRKALEFIEVNLHKDIGLEEIARACAASISSLTRGFKSALGVSPHQWVVTRRIALAQRLMSGSNKTMTEIALACGFADQSHFSRAFSQRIGSSPTAWRRSMQR